MEFAIERQDKESCFFILKKMLPAIKEKWQPKDSLLCQNISGTDTAFLSSKFLDIIRDDLINKEEFAFVREKFVFIRENEEFNEFITKISD